MSSSSTLAVFVIGGSALLLGYMFQDRLPPPKPKVVGIDLGTTYSAVGVYEAVHGTVRVIPDSKGRKTTPSVIHYRSHDNIVVGEEALENTEKDSLNVIYDAKRFIGRNLSLGELEKESLPYQFNINQPEKDGGVCFEVLPDTNKTCISPQEISSHIIKHLKEIAESNISRPITLAVMSVPADFDQTQRKFTKLAANLAGINVLRIINEPTAAALAYGLHKRKGINFVMVVDIGGGTSDISLMNIQGGMFVTTAMAGNNRLGGQDFNQNMFNYISNKINEKHGDWIWKYSENHQNLRMAIEKLKLEMTTADSAKLKLDLVGSKNNVNDKDKTIHFSQIITRSKFEQLNENLFKKVIELVQIVLDSAQMSASDVDEVVLVGGSTRIPKIREIITKFFKKKPNTAIDPETAVAHGVAVQAGIIGGMWPLQVSAIEIQHSSVKKIKVE